MAKLRDRKVKLMREPSYNPYLVHLDRKPQEPTQNMPEGLWRVALLAVLCGVAFVVVMVFFR